MYKNKIRDFRCEIGMNQEELARKAGISTGYLCHLEKGSRINPSIQVMEKIAKVLGKNIAEIFFNM